MIDGLMRISFEEQLGIIFVLLVVIGAGLVMLWDVFRLAQAGKKERAIQEGVKQRLENMHTLFISKDRVGDEERAQRLMEILKKDRD